MVEVASVASAEFSAAVVAAALSDGVSCRLAQREFAEARTEAIFLQELAVRSGERTYLASAGRLLAEVLIAEGNVDPGGRLPMNTHGGLLSNAHPGACGGLLGFTEAVRQLRGEAGVRQVDKRDMLSSRRRARWRPTSPSASSAPRSSKDQQ